MDNIIKDCLSALDRLENDALNSRDGYGYSGGDAETIRRAISENESLRRENDELKAKHCDAMRLLNKVKWQPIETAPKNKWLLLGYHNPLGHWRCVRGRWFDAQTIAEEWEFDGDSAQAEGFYEVVENSYNIPNCFPIDPTHWMPLPDAPEQR